MAKVSAEVGALLKALEKIKDRSSTEARAIRAKLRNLGYSLRDGGKKTKDEDEAPKKVKAKKVREEEEDEDADEEDDE